MINKVKKIIISKIKAMEPSKNKWPIEKLINGAMIGYKNSTGREFDINNPELFTDKIIWQKLFYKHSDMSRIVDKYDFKQYIDNKIGEGYTTKAYGVYNNIKELEKAWDKLPEQFVLKSTLQSDGNFIRIIKDKSACSFNEIKHEVRQWFKVKNTLINSYCRAYYNCTPRVIAEEYISQMNDDQLYDYKIFCFDGKPFCFYVATDHFQGCTSLITFYDLKWNKMDVQYGNHKTSESPKPKHMDEMIRLAEKLSKDFPFIRVDFFDTGEKLYLAELTFTPGGGLSLYHPQEFNKKMGDMLVLPEKNK